MTILENQIDDWEGKHNFVDKNNVLVGYDTSQQCCEHAGWYIADRIRDDVNEDDSITSGLDGYVFDINFMELNHSIDHCCEGGGIVVFRLYEEGNPDLFLHLFNVHNGYYSHGFTMTQNGVIINGGKI